ncbi:MAG: FtsQ-type POTRA domain-containing protein [bacterium]|nr:FtsQ-type POTRA domain-containing protein [bacterium]
MLYRKKHLYPKIKKLKPKRLFFKRPGFWVVVSLLTISCGVYYGLFSQKLQVLGVEILGNEKITAGEIEDVAKESIKRELLGAGLFAISSRSILVADKKSTIKDILTTFPKIKEVKVQRKLPQKVIVSVKERTAVAIFCHTQGSCFFIDDEGIIFEEAKDVPGGMLTVWNEGSQAEAVPGAAMVKKNIISAIVDIEKSLKEHFQIGVNEVRVGKPLVVKTAENWDIYFDTEQDMAGQITKMNLLLKDEIPVEARQGIQYIYLQYKDRAYYK